MPVYIQAVTALQGALALHVFQAAVRHPAADLPVDIEMDTRFVKLVYFHAEY